MAQTRVFHRDRTGQGCLRPCCALSPGSPPGGSDNRRVVVDRLAVRLRALSNSASLLTLLVDSSNLFRRTCAVLSWQILHILTTPTSLQHGERFVVFTCWDPFCGSHGGYLTQDSPSLLGALLESAFLYDALSKVFLSSSTTALPFAPLRFDGLRRNCSGVSSACSSGSLCMLNNWQIRSKSFFNQTFRSPQDIPVSCWRLWRAGMLPEASMVLEPLHTYSAVP